MYSQADLDFLIALVQARSGIALGPEKAYLIEGRLPSLLRQHGLSDIGHLVRVLRQGGVDRLASAVVEAMATHESSFFRDALMFDHLAGDILPAFRRRRLSTRRLRFWSAACAFGQEPVSLAILMAEYSAAFTGWTIDYLATDLSSVAIARCRRAFYSHFEIERGLSEARRRRFFNEVDKGWVVAPELLKSIDYEQRNLLDVVDPVDRVFDIILLRNVLIYFDRPTRLRVLQAVRRHLANDGILILGGTEDAVDFGPGFERAGSRCFYRPVESDLLVAAQ